MDSLFQSFNATISVANFAELSACVFSWLEEYCKPQVTNLLNLNKPIGLSHLGDLGVFFIYCIFSSMKFL